MFGLVVVIIKIIYYRDAGIYTSAGDNSLTEWIMSSFNGVACTVQLHYNKINSTEC